MAGTHLQISNGLKDELSSGRKRLSLVLRNVDVSSVSVERVQLKDRQDCLRKTVQEDCRGPQLPHAPPSSVPFSIEASSPVHSAWLMHLSINCRSCQCWSLFSLGDRKVETLN